MLLQCICLNTRERKSSQAVRRSTAFLLWRPERLPAIAHKMDFLRGFRRPRRLCGVVQGLLAQAPGMWARPGSCFAW